MNPYKYLITFETRMRYAFVRILIGVNKTHGTIFIVRRLLTLRTDAARRWYSSDGYDSI